MLLKAPCQQLPAGRQHLLLLLLLVTVQVQVQGPGEFQVRAAVAHLLRSGQQQHLQPPQRQQVQAQLLHQHNAAAGSLGAASRCLAVQAAPRQIFPLGALLGPWAW